MRSNVIKKGVERAPQRSLLRALGLTSKEIQQPLVGIVNSFNEVIPGHIHLRAIAEAVKAGVHSAGGTPLEFNTIGVCDGIAMGHLGMRYSLPSRELIADSVEIMVHAHGFDALVFIPNCDKIIPGMLMAAVRLNLPSIFVSGGPMLAGRLGNGRIVDLNSVFEAVGKSAKGQMSRAELTELEDKACPGCGSCSGLFTANTMNCLTEALGMGLPGNGTIPAVDARRIRLAKEAGSKVMELLESDIRPRDIVTKDSIYNAFVIDMALGGSTNSVLHLMALAHEAGVDFSLKAIDGISQRTPHLTKISPSGEYHLDGRSVERLSPGELARIRNVEIGFVFQSYNLLPRFDALHNVELPLIYSSVPAGERRAKAEKALADLGLSERQRHRPHALSGGQQQRVAIARALVNSPRLILADEPTGNLDSHSSMEIMEVLKRLNQDGITIVLVTHENDIAACARRVLKFRDGCLIEDSCQSRQESRCAQ